MSRAEKILEQWEERRPTEVSRGEVEAVLEAFFPGQWGLLSGSHIVVRSAILKKYKRFQPYGEVMLALKKGRKVKFFYIKDLIDAIKVIKFDEEQG